MKRPAPRMRVYGAGLARNGQSAKAESDHFVSSCVLTDHAKKNGIGRVFKCPGGTAVHRDVSKNERNEFHHDQN